MPVEPFFEEAVGPEPAMPNQGPAPEVTHRTPRQIRRTRRARALKRFWKEYRQNRLGMVGLIVLLFFILVAIFAPLITPRSATSEVVAAAKDQPITVNPGYHCPQSDIHRVEYTAPNPNAGPGEPAVIQKQKVVESCPSSKKTLYPLGTDGAGRSMIALLVWGARISLIVGLVATVMTMLIGAGIGIAAGFYGGRIDVALSRLTDWFLVIPWIALAIVLASVLGQSLFNIILVIGVTSWAVTARLVRAQALSVVTRPYVERARALGASNWHIITRHVLPNLFPIIFANTILTVALSILSESLLSFLGLGDPNSVSWGQVLEEAQNAGATTGGQWWWVLPPGLCITTVVLAFTMCGFAIEEITNPRLRRR